MTDSNNGVSLMQSGDYDGGSFSGDATQRLMAGGIVAPVNTALIPNYANIFEGLKNKSHNSLDGVPYGVPHGRGPNLLMYNTDVVTTAPTSLGPGLERRRRRDRQGQRLRLLDLHRRRGAAPDEDAARPRHHQPLPAERRRSSTRRSRCSRSSATPAPSTGAPTADQVASYAAGDVTTGTSWQFQANLLQGESQPIAGGLARRRFDRLVGHLDDREEGEEPQLHVHVDGPHGVRRGQRPGHGLVRRGTDEPGRRATTPRRISPGHCELTHATDEAYYDKIWYWSTPQADCADDDDATTCKDQDDWVEAWTKLRGA